MQASANVATVAAVGRVEVILDYRIRRAWHFDASFGSSWIIVVALKADRDQNGDMRSILALASAFAWFGQGLGGLIPAYVLTIWELFPAAEASWRIPTLLLLSGAGMGTGGWLGGVLYDYFGYYAPAFAAGIAANLLNFALIAAIFARQIYVWYRDR